MSKLTADHFAHLDSIVNDYRPAAEQMVGEDRTSPAKLTLFVHATVSKFLIAIHAAIADRSAPPPKFVAASSGALVHAIGYATAIALLGGSKIGREDGERIGRTVVDLFRAGFDDAVARQLEPSSPSVCAAAKDGAPMPRANASKETDRDKAGEAERRNYASWK